jgi:hypothetical protein
VSQFPNLTTVQRDALIAVVASRVEFTCMTNAQGVKYSVGGRGGPTIKQATIRSLAKKGLINTESVLDRMYGRTRVIHPTQLGYQMSVHFGWTS